MNTKMKILTISISIMILASIKNGACQNTKVVIHVPGDYITIQNAINSASNGDTILVATGTYFENLNLKGKNVILTSNYIYSNDFNDILNTVIDGGSPQHPDTASVILIVNGEDSTTAVNGFTLQNGKGTVWEDEHGPGNFYTEGGAFLIQASSPTISNNLIINNEAINEEGSITSAGGGAIRSGDGNPTIINNVIIHNEGLYGGGIVLNYSGAKIYNNIIAFNSGGQDFGGGGLWILGSPVADIEIINNHILGNYSYLTGGGIRFWSTQATVKNCIIWNNRSMYSSPQIQGNADVTYSVVEGGYNGEGNLDVYPQFTEAQLYLNNNSPCIDAGNEQDVYNDIEDDSNPEFALWPSLGTLVNDMGAYGGPLAKLLVPFVNNDNIVLEDEINFDPTAPPDSTRYNYLILNNGTNTTTIDSIKLISAENDELACQTNFPLAIEPMSQDTVILWWKPYSNSSLNATMQVYHKDPDLTYPFEVEIQGLNTSNVRNFNKKVPLSMVSPNPTEGIFEITFSGLLFVQDIEIFNIMGEPILNSPVNAEKDSIQLDLQNEKSGLYLIKCHFKDGQSSTLKILKK